MSKPRKDIIIQADHAEIHLKQGHVALIDLCDVEKASKYGWILDDNKPNWYVHACVERIRKTLRLHRYLLDAPKNMVVDHIDGNGLNNRRSNLRLCTQANNCANRRKIKKTSSKYKGVYKRENGRWRACVRVNKKLHNLGTFVDEIEAARAYNKAAEQYFGEWACLNQNV